MERSTGWNIFNGTDVFYKFTEGGTFYQVVNNFDEFVKTNLLEEFVQNVIYLKITEVCLVRRIMQGLQNGIS